MDWNGEIDDRNIMGNTHHTHRDNNPNPNPKTKERTIVPFAEELIDVGVERAVFDHQRHQLPLQPFHIQLCQNKQTTIENRRTEDRQIDREFK